jgi:hypothetical protein
MLLGLVGYLLSFRHDNKFMFGQLGISREGDHCVGVWGGGEEDGWKWMKSPHYEEKYLKSGI